MLCIGVRSHPAQNTVSSASPLHLALPLQLSTACSDPDDLFNSALPVQLSIASFCRDTAVQPGALCSLIQTRHLRLG